VPFVNGEPSESQPAALPPDAAPPAERRGPDDRRRTDRRREQQPVAIERRSGVDRRQASERRGVNRYELSADEMEFVHAIQRWKERTGKAFPAWSEVLAILRSLGYEKRA
jgi:hypothetical protein